jgi:hypothetical protein
MRAECFPIQLGEIYRILSALWGFAGLRAATGHPIIMSFEPGKNWFFDYEKQGMVNGVELLRPHSRPEDQPTLGPAERVPANWESLPH